MQNLITDREGYGNKDVDQEYTPLFIDLMDAHNQDGEIYLGFPTGSVNDNVFGYSISLLETHVISGLGSQSELAEKLKNNKPAGVTDAQIDQLISFYY